MRRMAVAGALAVLALAAGTARAQETPSVPGPDVPADAPAPAETAPAPGGLAALPETLAGAAGTWDLAREGGMRRCVLTLSMDASPSGRAARFPAGCRRALPLMAGITGWLFTSEGLRLVDRDARPLLAFTKNADGMSLGATAENGERYNLVPLRIAAMQPPPASPAAGAGRPTPVAAEAGAAVPATPPVPDGPAPGLYALDRAARKDVCRLELAAPTETERDKAAVRMLPDCRDSGITVFDPVSWRFANGHLTLKARRGHAVNLVAVGEGRWRRDPDIGVSLELRKVEP
ncbi:MAG: AprI/Inh family metalloprotease inhibitor [Methylorubrum populi]